MLGVCQAGIGKAERGILQLLLRAPQQLLSPYVSVQKLTCKVQSEITVSCLDVRLLQGQVDPSVPVLDVLMRLLKFDKLDLRRPRARSDTDRLMYRAMKKTRSPNTLSGTVCCTQVHGVLSGPRPLTHTYAARLV